MTQPVPVPQATLCGATSCPLYVSLREHMEAQFVANAKAVELAREAIEYRLREMVVQQLTRYPDRPAIEKLETRLSKLEEASALSAGKISFVVASITIGIGALLSLLHMFQQR